MKSRFVKKFISSIIIIIIVCMLSISASALSVYFKNVTIQSNMPITVCAFASASYGLNIYAFGGNSAAQYSSGLVTAGVKTVQMYDPCANTWTTKADMPTARRFCAAVTVNGLIYVIGGSYKENSIAYATDKNEAYNPATDTWTTKASLPVALHDVSATVVDGMVYVVGGATISNNALTVVNTVYMYNPCTDTWTQKASLPTAKIVRTVEANGMIYAIGGFNGSTIYSTVEMYNPVTNSWSTKASMGIARFGEVFQVLDSKIYAMGGCINTRYAATNSVEEYDIDTNTWVTANSSLNSARGYMGLLEVGNSYFVFGGLNTSSNLYSQLEKYYWAGVMKFSSMPTTVSAFASATVDGKIYAFGGNSAAQYSTGLVTGGVTAVQMYTPSTDTWMTKTSMPTARRFCAAAVINGIVYVIGGSYKVNYTAYATDKNEAYNPATDTWTTKASLPVALHDVSATVVNDKIYVIGGATISGSTYTPVSTVYMYDPSTDIWTQEASMPTSRIVRTVEAGGMIYAIGGFNPSSSTIYSTVEMYNPSTNIWSTKASMGTARFGEEFLIFNNKIFVIGGAINTSYGATNTIEEYDIQTNTWKYHDVGLNSVRGYMGLSVIEDRFFVFGGMNTSSNLYNQLEGYLIVSLLDWWE